MESRESGFQQPSGLMDLITKIENVRRGTGLDELRIE